MTPPLPLSSNSERSRNRTVRDRLQKRWEQARADYRAAGCPLGPSIRALEVWIEYGRRTTAN